MTWWYGADGRPPVIFQDSLTVSFHEDRLMYARATRRDVPLVLRDSTTTPFRLELDPRDLPEELIRHEGEWFEHAFPCREES